MYNIRTAIQLLKNDRKTLLATIITTFFKWLPDKVYLKIVFKLKTGLSLNLKNPQTYTEKLNWLKLNDIHPEYTQLVDKYSVKEFVQERLKSEENIIKTLGVWNNFDEIDFSMLPNKFVLKTNNGGGNTSVVICKDKSKFNIEDARKKLILKDGLQHFYWSREYPYYNVKPCIFAEEYIEAPDGELSDYKFFCFNGVPKFLFVATERQKEGEDVKFDFYDTKFTHLPIKNGHDNAAVPPQKPINFYKMLEIAATLSAGFPHVRVDLYNLNGKIYFGEYTFFHFAGFVPMKPEEWDSKFGEYLQLPTVP